MERRSDGPFRVRLAFSDRDYITVTVAEETTNDARKEAIARAVGLPAKSVILRKVFEVGPPVRYGPFIAGFHALLQGPHEVYDAREVDIFRLGKIQS